MQVTLIGVIGDDGLTGRADRIKVENEVRGPIGEILGADSFTVLGQTVFVSFATVFQNVSGLGALGPGDVVEVHGQRDGSGAIHATRVELKEGPGLLDEIRGTVSDHVGAAQTFRIGTQQVHYGNAEIRPAGATLADGLLVEVHGSLEGAVFVASRVEIEDRVAGEFAPAEGQRFQVEGFVTGFTDPSLPFFVNGREVRLAAVVRFRAGLESDLADNVKVQAQGQVIDGILVADRITFKDAIRIESNATDNTATTVTLLGKIVHIASTTDNRLENGLTGGIRIRGFLNLDGSITATRIENRDEVEPGRHILQGLVGEFDEAASTFVIIGITVDASGAEFRDDRGDNDDRQITAAEFFGALVPDGTVVKARGSFDAATMTLTANRAELER
jgi:hypothetical protein